ncbi:MAG: hypothetical protein AABX24_00035 [Nanoarchaeota archaeon]
MNFQFTGKDEPEGLYQEFFGRPKKEMPRLIAEGYDPISVAGLIDRRESAPADVVNTWRCNYVFTSDAIAYDEKNNAKIVLDAKLLRDINPHTKFNNRARVLSAAQWENLRGDEVLYLSADEVEQTDKKGFVKRNGFWQPENNVVGDIWEGTDSFPGLARRKNLDDYIDLVSKASNGDTFLRLWFDEDKRTSPTMLSLVVFSIYLNSRVIGYGNLDNKYARFVGTTPELPRPYAESSLTPSSRLEDTLIPEKKPWYRRLLGIK